MNELALSALENIVLAVWSRNIFFIGTLEIVEKVFIVWDRELALV